MRRVWITSSSAAPRSSFGSSAVITITATASLEFAKEDLNEMAKSKQPFYMELVTIDTHTPDGYVCEECKHEYESQYANVISCQSRQVEAFVRWCQKQDWYENTTIVITGDHKSMSEKFFKHLDKNYLRTPYNCFINSAVEPDRKSVV